MWLFRLCVDDYHRYIYNVSGKQSDVRRIEGLYHTVNPIASEYYDIYKENTREYCLIRTQDAGTIIDMEVGALLVGRIVNRYVDSTDVRRGEEKGYFEFGGSTIILLIQKDKVAPLDRIVENSRKDIETRVRQGELVGYVMLRAILYIPYKTGTAYACYGAIRCSCLLFIQSVSELIFYIIHL